MALSSLPPAVRTTLTSLLTDHNVSSWKVNVDGEDVVFILHLNSKSRPQQQQPQNQHRPSAPQQAANPQQRPNTSPPPPPPLQQQQQKQQQQTQLQQPQHKQQQQDELKLLQQTLVAVTGTKPKPRADSVRSSIYEKPKDGTDSPGSQRRQRSVSAAASTTVDYSPPGSVAEIISKTFRRVDPTTEKNDKTALLPNLGPRPFNKVITNDTPSVKPFGGTSTDKTDTGFRRVPWKPLIEKTADPDNTNFQSITEAENAARSRAFDPEKVRRLVTGTDDVTKCNLRSSGRNRGLNKVVSTTKGGKRTLIGESDDFVLTFDCMAKVVVDFDIKQDEGETLEKPRYTSLTLRWSQQVDMDTHPMEIEHMRQDLLVLAKVTQCFLQDA